MEGVQRNEALLPGRPWAVAWDSLWHLSKVLTSWRHGGVGV
jgi:hypothetical protein